MLDFPINPTSGQLYTSGWSSWMWDGAKWMASVPSGGVYLPMFAGSQFPLYGFLYNSTPGDPGFSTVWSGLGATRFRFKVNPGDEFTAGSIDYRGLAASALSIVGAGTTSGNRQIFLYDNVAVAGNLSIGSTTVVADGLSVVGGINSTGPNAQISWQDRGNAASVWLWYAQGGITRLYNAGDRIWIDGSGNLSTQGIVTVGGNFVCFGGGTTSAGPFIAASPTDFAHRLGPSNGAFYFQDYGGTARLIVTSYGLTAVNGAQGSFGESLAVLRTPAVDALNWWETATASLQDARPMTNGVGGHLIFEGKWNSAGAWTPWGGIGGRKALATDGDYTANIAIWARGGTINLFSTLYGGIADGLMFRFSPTDLGPQTVYASLSPTRWRMRTAVGDEAAAGTIDYRGYSDALNIVGAGTTGLNRVVRLWDNVAVPGNIEAGGSIAATGPNSCLVVFDRAGSSYTNWLWYAYGGTVRLYNGADRMSINSAGIVTVSSDLYVQGANVWLAGGGPVGPRMSADTTNIAWQTGSGNGHYFWYNTAGAQLAKLDNGGSLWLAGNAIVKNVLYFLNAATPPYLYADATNVIIRIGSGGGNFYIQSNAGNNQAYITSSGTIVGNEDVYAGRVVRTQNYLQFLGGGIGAAPYLYFNTVDCVMRLAGQGWFYWQSGDGVERMRLQSDGQLVVSGGITVAGLLTVASINSPNINAVGTGAWLGFNNRSSPGSGDWGWYAVNSMARLYNGADRLQVDWDGTVYTYGNVIMSNNYWIWWKSNTGANLPILLLGSNNEVYLSEASRPLHLRGNYTYIEGVVVVAGSTIGFQGYTGGLGGGAGGPILYADANWFVMKPGSGNGGVLVYDYNASTRAEIRTDGTFWAFGVGSPALGQYRMCQNNAGSGYGSAWYNDGSATYLLLTNNNDSQGGMNGLRPFICDSASGKLTFQHGLQVNGAMSKYYGGIQIFNGGGGGSNLNVFDDGNSHVDSSTTLWLNWNGTQVICGGPLQVYGGTTFNAYVYMNGGARVYNGGSDPHEVFAPNGQHARTRYHVSGQRIWSVGVVNWGSWYLADESAGAARVEIDTNGTFFHRNAVVIPNNYYLWFQDTNGSLRYGVILANDNQYYISDGSLNIIFRAPNYYFNSGRAWFPGGWSTSGQCYYDGPGPVLANGQFLKGKDTGGNPQNILAIWGDNHIYLSESNRPLHLRSNNCYIEGRVHCNAEINSEGGTAGLWFDQRVGGDAFMFYAANGTAQLWKSNIGDRIYFHQDMHIYPAGGSSATCGNNAWWNVISNNFSNPSDPKLKQDIEPHPPALEAVRALKPVTYRWRKGRNTDRRHHGWLSTDVRAVLGDDFGGLIYNEPTNDHDGYDALAVNQLMAVLWRAVQELADEVETLKGQLH